MSRSNCEEVIGILWFILSLMLIDRNCIVLGKIAFGAGAFAMLCAVVLTLREAVKKQRDKALKDK